MVAWKCTAAGRRQQSYHRRRRKWRWQPDPGNRTQAQAGGWFLTHTRALRPVSIYRRLLAPGRAAILGGKMRNVHIPFVIKFVQPPLLPLHSPVQCESALRHGYSTQNYLQARNSQDFFSACCSEILLNCQNKPSVFSASWGVFRDLLFLKPN